MTRMPSTTSASVKKRPRSGTDTNTARPLASRLLVLRAGQGPSNNLIRTLKAGDPSLFIIGSHDNRYTLKRSIADRNYLVPESSHPDFGRILNQVIRTERVDLVIPNSEGDVRTISDMRRKLPCRVFLPSRRVIDLCQDKYELGEYLRRRGLPVPVTYPVTSLDGIDDICERFPSQRTLWCRIRNGSSSFGAVPVKTSAQARSWIAYWQEMRGISPSSFTLSEYLPGSDYCVQSLWSAGELVMTKMHERLSYYVAGSSASGVSSTAAVAKIVMKPRVATMCAEAIKAIDPRASGVFFVDVKESDRGRPSITEINAGRFANVSTIHDAVANQSTALLYVRLALGNPVALTNYHEPEAPAYVLRDLDATPANVREDELFENVCELPPMKKLLAAAEAAEDVAVFHIRTM